MNIEYKKKSYILKFKLTCTKYSDICLVAIAQFFAISTLLIRIPGNALAEILDISRLRNCLKDYTVIIGYTNTVHSNRPPHLHVKLSISNHVTSFEVCDMWLCLSF